MTVGVWHRALGAVLISVAASACSTLGPTSFASLRPAATRILLPVPFRRQHTEDECAMAAASMVAAYYRQSLQPQTIASLKADAEANGGVSGRELEAALGQSGFYSVIFHGSFRHDDTGLYHHLKRGRPIIIMLMQHGTLNGRRTQYGHYVVAVGFDATRGKEYILDPLRGAVVYSESRLKNYWENSGYFSDLVMPDHLVSGGNSKSTQ